MNSPHDCSRSYQSHMISCLLKGIKKIKIIPALGKSTLASDWQQSKFNSVSYLKRRQIKTMSTGQLALLSAEAKKKNIKETLDVNMLCISICILQVVLFYNLKRHAASSEMQAGSDF